jgi:hypothetical protein
MIERFPIGLVGQRVRHEVSRFFASHQENHMGAADGSYLGGGFGPSTLDGLEWLTVTECFEMAL